MGENFWFPMELEREIFETAALLYPKVIPTLLRVCRRVHVWIEPLLYRVLILPGREGDDQRVGKKLISALESKAPAFLQNSVRAVFLHGHMADIYTDLLSKCSETTNLSMGAGSNLSYLAALANMRLRRLALLVPSIWTEWTPVDLNHSLLRTVTHLDLYHPQSMQSTWESWSGLASLPALTHLALSPLIASEILPQVVRECPRLLMVVVMVYSWAENTASEFAQRLAIADPRVVAMAMAIGYDEDWERGASGGEDFWVRAERFLAQKKAGTIDKNCYLLDEIMALAS
ncbi:hypothetical protein DFH06DRAFT_1250241 [Mycena polygramma]|nr:hypothetical protein DFH06DRAFT_1250241 [Mycena polygramma]